jgi:hypothetical protein
MQLGTAIEKIVKPIARAAGMSCLDADGNLKPESGCAKRRDRLNNLTKGNMPNPVVQPTPKPPQPAGKIKLIIQQSGNGGWIVSAFKGAQPSDPNVYANDVDLLAAMPQLIGQPTKV